MITTSSGLLAATWEPERKLKFKFEIQWDGVNWIDESQYVKNITGFEELQGELGQSTSSEIDVTLWNNQERFTPDNTDSSLYGQLKLNKEARLQIGFGDIYSGEPLLINKFYGMIESITPSEGERTVAIHLFDKSKKFKEEKVRTRMFQNHRTEELVSILASGVENNLDLEVGKQQVSFAYFDDHVIWGRMQELAEAEGGRVFYDYDTLTFWNREHLNGLTPIENLGQFWWLLSISQSISNVDVKNNIEIIAKPRDVEAFQPIFTQESAKEFLPNKQLSFWIEFIDIDDLAMPVLSAVSPLGSNPDTTSYFRANTSADGTGSDRTGSVQLKGFDLFGTSAKIRLFGSPGTFLTALQVWGIPAKIVKIIKEEQEDLVSIREFGKKTLTIKNDFIDSEDYARLLSIELLKRYKNLKSNFSIKTIGIPYLQPGDVVEVQLTENRIDIEPDNDIITLDVHSLDGDEQLAEGPTVAGSDYMIKAIRYYLGPDAGFYQELALINPYLP